MDIPSPHDLLFGEKVDRALRSIPKNADSLGVITHLRGCLGATLARRAARLHELRLRSNQRFPKGFLPFLTPKGLEQATSHVVAEARAKRLRELLGPSRIWDATCGIGADSLALAERGDVVATELDPEQAACAAANLAQAGSPGRVLRADALLPPFEPKRMAAVLLDPDRRPRGKREGDPERWSPPLSSCLSLAERVGAGCLKLPPAFELPDPGRGVAQRWVSLDGTLREYSLWTGRLARDRSPRAAILLTSDGKREVLAGEIEATRPLHPDAARQVRWLGEVDPAVLRSGLLGLAARLCGLDPLAPRSAYLGGLDPPTPQPWLKTWRVLGTSALDRRRLRRLQREHDIGPLTVKKRGHPDSAETLARRFAGPGRRPGLLAVTRLERGHLALLLEDSRPPASPPPGDREGPDGP